MLVDKKTSKIFLQQYQLMLLTVYGKEPASPAEWRQARRKMLAQLGEGKFLNIQPEVSLNFIEATAHGIYGDFIFLKRYKNHCALMNLETEKYYGVRSLTTPLEDMLPEYSQIYTGLIPYKGLLICDGLIETNNVILGPNLAKSFRDGYWKAKKENKLISSMEYE